MNGVEAFGFLAVTAGVVTYALERRSPVYVLAFAGTCLAGAVYASLIHSWPFAAVEVVWTVIAFRRWLGARKS